MSGSLGFPLQLTDPGNYWDLRIVDDDIALDVGRQPLKLADRASIAQDIAHMIRERGYLTAMIAERDIRKRRYHMVLITIAVDDDTRIVLFVRPTDEHLVESGPVVAPAALADEIRLVLRTQCSPRHVPARIVAVPDLPRTRSGKLAELAVADVVHGRPVRNTEALANPESLELFLGLEELAR